jgi:hypothetical protein
MALYRDKVGIVFKNSNRSNSKIKIKIMNNKTPDEIVTANKIPGIPDNAIILEIGFGEQLIQSYIKKYKIV